jgi:ABC-type lipoprotein export system ATPase subunit
LHAEGNTILLVTHERDIADHAERILLIRDGRIEQDLPNALRRSRRTASRPASVVPP